MITNTIITNSTTTIFTSSNDNAINLMVFCNTDDTTTLLLTVYVIPQADSASPANKHIIIRKTKLNPLETLTFSTEKLILANGDTIRAKATLTDGSSAPPTDSMASTVSSIAL